MSYFHKIIFSHVGYSCDFFLLMPPHSNCSYLCTYVFILMSYHINYTHKNRRFFLLLSKYFELFTLEHRHIHVPQLACFSNIVAIREFLFGNRNQKKKQHSFSSILLFSSFFLSMFFFSRNFHRNLSASFLVVFSQVVSFMYSILIFVSLFFLCVNCKANYFLM